MAAESSTDAPPAVPAPSGAGIVHLPPRLCVDTAARTRELLLEVLADADGDVVVDGRDVTDIDASGVQVLLSLRRSLVARGRDLVLSASPALDGALRFVGQPLPWSAHASDAEGP